MSCHSAEHSSLQNHSVGEIYPYSIKRVGDSYYQPFHCITGEEGPKYDLSNRLAHSLAENWALDQLNESKRLQERAKEDAKKLAFASYGPENPTLVEYTFLVPNTYNDTKEVIHHEFWYWLNSELAGLFGGFTLGSTVQGKWTNDTGDKIDDFSQTYLVAIQPAHKHKLVNLLGAIKRKTRQDCIYLAKTSDCVEFI